MIWAIAVRNLWQHKTKTIIIGLLVAIGVMLTFAGNAMIDTMIRNISRIFTEYYTGDVLVTSSETLGAGVFGAQSDDVVGFPVIPVLRDYDAVIEHVASLPGVQAVTPQLSGYAMYNFDDGSMDFNLFFGIEPDSYFPVMDSIEIVEGRRLEQGESGVIIQYNTWKDFRENKGRDLQVGGTVSLTSFGTSGVRIRELPIVGVFRFPAGNDRLFPMSFIDARSLRYILGPVGGMTEKVEVPQAATALLDADIDSLFSDDFFFDADPAVLASSTGVVTAANVFDILGGAPPVRPETGEGGWHFILIRMEDGVSPASAIKTLNTAFDDEDLLARAQSWWESAMPDSLTYSGVQLLFNVAIIILGFVSIIIIMNTLVVSVMERTSEIGTMRALGARKSFVRKLFIVETAFITLVFGGIGLVLGACIIGVLHQVGIPTDNDALRYLGGGVVIRPTITAQPVIMSLVLMGIIGLFSWIYPVAIALKVSPLKAITTE